MRKVAVFLLSGVLMFSLSCATPTAWYNSTKSNQEFYSDRARCSAMANSAGYPQTTPVYGSGALASYARTSNMLSSIAADNSRIQIFNDCMMGEGWTLVPVK
ncbi:MAG: hypothetical protein ACHQYP_06005 [Nitrospiria bacterium]